MRLSWVLSGARESRRPEKERPTTHVFVATHSPNPGRGTIPESCLDFLMESSLLKFICIFAMCIMSAAVELLVLPEGVKHSIPCTAPANGIYLINWIVDGEQPGDGFVVGEK